MTSFQKTMLAIIASIACTALVFAVLSFAKVIKIDPITINAREKCDFYIQGSQFGAQAQQDVINQELTKQAGQGEVDLGGTIFVPKEEE